MIIYHIVQYSLLLIICTYLVNYYAAKSVSFHVKFWSVITWTLNFAITLLVPQDVYQTLDSQSQPKSPTNQLSSLGWQYLILYWLVYLLTWTIIPVLQEWENSGDLQSSDRMKRSLRVNGIFYLWMLIGGAIALGLMIWFDVGAQMGLITFLKCMATVWGLFLLMVLMGYALVQIPKTLWNNADPKSYLTYLYQKANDVEDEIEQAQQEFTKIVGYILYIERQSTKNPTQQSASIQLYCSESLKLIPEEYKDLINSKPSYADFLQQIGYLEGYPVNLESAIEHLRLLKRAISHCKRLERSFDYYCKNAILYEDILLSLPKNTSVQNDQIKQYNFETELTPVNQKNNSQTKFISGSNTSLDQQLIINKNTQNQSRNFHTKLFQVKWYHSLWYMKYRKLVNRFLALIIGTGAVFLLAAQTQVFLTNQSSILAWLLTIKNFQILRIVVFIVIVFIMYMVNYSLFRLKLSNLYGLYCKDSDGPSLMFATVNFSRVGVVIVLNFFDMMKMDSEYKAVMGTIDMGLIGEWIIKGLPGILWLMVLTHYFNVWGWLMNALKIDNSLSFNSHSVEGDFNAKGLSIVSKKKANNVKRTDEFFKSHEIPEMIQVPKYQDIYIFFHKFNQAIIFIKLQMNLIKIGNK